MPISEVRRDGRNEFVDDRIGVINQLEISKEQDKGEEERSKETSGWTKLKARSQGTG